MCTAAPPAVQVNWINVLCLHLAIYRQDFFFFKYSKDFFFVSIGSEVLNLSVLKIHTENKYLHIIFRKIF